MKKMTPMMIAASAIIALSSSAFAEVDDIALNKTSHEPSGAMAHETLNLTIQKNSVRCNHSSISSELTRVSAMDTFHPD